MNLSIDQFLIGLERSAQNIFGVLAAWRDLDPELQDHYAEQLEWLIESQPEVRERARAVGRERELEARLGPANAMFVLVRDAISEVMGVSVDPLLAPATTVVGGHVARDECFGAIAA